VRPSVRVSDVEFAAQKLHDGFDIKYELVDAGRRPLRIARFKDNTDTRPDVLVFRSVQEAFEYLVDVYVSYMQALAAG